MNFRKFTIVAASATTVTAAMLGVTSASASIAPSPRAEHFLIMSTSTTSTQATIIGTGEFIVSGAVTGDFAGSGADEMVVPGGSFRFIAKKISIAEGVGRNCLTIGSGDGTYKISGGTGKYAGISGSGKFVLSAEQAAAREAEEEPGWRPGRLRLLVESVDSAG